VNGKAVHTLPHGARALTRGVLILGAATALRTFVLCVTPLSLTEIMWCLALSLLGVGFARTWRDAERGDVSVRAAGLTGLSVLLLLGEFGLAHLYRQADAPYQALPGSVAYTAVLTDGHTVRGEIDRRELFCVLHASAMVSRPAVLTARLEGAEVGGQAYTLSPAVPVRSLRVAPQTQAAFLSADSLSADCRKDERLTLDPRI